MGANYNGTLVTNENHLASGDTPSAVLKHQPPQAPKPYDDEIELLELWHALMRGKWIVIAFTAVFSLASVFYALSLPDMYKSTAVLAPAEPSGGMGKLAGEFGGLAALAGINLAGGELNKTAEALEILQSWAFIEEFIDENNIAPLVFAVNGWSREDDTLLYNQAMYDVNSTTWTREPPSGKLPKPSSWELYEKFSEMLSVVDVKSDGFVIVEVEYFSPIVAKQWVDALIIKINERMRSVDLDAAQRNISFLKDQIENTSLTNMQAVFYDLIEDQTRTLMLAKGATEYMFRTVSESRVAEVRSSPNRVLICFLGAFLGFVVGALIVIIRFK